jgi:hypothetical protein
MRDPQGHALGRSRVGPFPKNSQIRCFYDFRGSSAHAGRDLADVAAGAAGRWVGVMEGPTGAPSKAAFQAYLALINPNFRPFGSRSPQKRLRNGERNGRVSAKVTASASPRGDQRSWGVASPSDQASRRSNPACARVPPGPFSRRSYGVLRPCIPF